MDRCRYDLGSGAALIRSADKLQLNRYHTVLARRFRRDGVLRVDSGDEMSGTSPGMLRALNVWTPFYVGYLPNATARSDACLLAYSLESALSFVVDHSLLSTSLRCRWPRYSAHNSGDLAIIKHRPT